MNEYEERALAKLHDAYISSKTVVDKIIDEHDYVLGMVKLFTYACKDTPGDAHATLLRIQQHLDKMLNALLVLHNTTALVNTVVNEHCFTVLNDKDAEVLNEH